MSRRPPAHEALVLDEMFSPKLAENLRRRGFDVIVVADDPQLRAKSDAELCDWAAQEDRRIVTENVKDFRPLAVARRGSPRLLFTSSRTFPRSRRSFGAISNALQEWLESPAQDSRPAEDWLWRR